MKNTAQPKPLARAKEPRKPAQPARSANSPRPAGTKRGAGPGRKGDPARAGLSGTAIEEPREPRRALSHVGGPSETRGEPELCQVLAHGLAVRADERQSMAHVHGFHTYTARLHPLTASRLIAGLLRKPMGNVLDPFCGSGTVLSEARLLGHRAMGVDANPLAIELSWLKTLGASEDFTDQLLEQTARVVELAEQRRKAKSGATHPYPDHVRALFDAHVLFELDSLKLGISRVHHADTRRALRLVLSAVLGKVSRRPQDSTRHPEARRIASGFTIRFFEAKVEDLVERLGVYAKRLPAKAPQPRGAVGDARVLAEVPSGWADLVLTSPPYASVYDYYSHHDMRLEWLELGGFLEHHEIGSRRQLSRLPPSEALALWSQDLEQVFRQVRRTMAPSGLAAFVIGDSALGRMPVFADELALKVAERSGLEFRALASQARPIFHAPSERAFAARPRREHVVVLGRSSSR